MLQESQQPVAAPAAYPTLVLGLGNILMRDEGIGVRVIEALQGRQLPPGVELFDGATAGPDLLDVLAGRRQVIVIDALDGDYEPGTVLLLNASDLAAQPRQCVSLHEIGLFETLAMTRMLGESPRGVVIIGVKPFDVSCGLALSPGLTHLLPRIIDVVLAELAQRAAS
ncbi:MAG: HyaD/HybD family hydrogenase maturation endopeptidase [Phycisphaerae bacterium]|nr:HyaD/HybD family hydrogenase maturation endopeptidase [Phycisphaerae bacterium]